MKVPAILGAALLALAGLGAHADDSKAGSLRIVQPWARATVAGQTAGGAFLRIENGGAADRLLSASAPVAGSVELHTMAMDGDVMRMHAVPAIDLPAGKTVEFEPGGLHIMFIGLKAPLAEGATIPLRLKFEKAGEVQVTVKVQAAGDAGPMKPMKP
jgi:periplasmic copper chaperone A